MSYKIQASISCDGGCGASFISGIETKSTHIRSVLREINRKAMMAGWLTVSCQNPKNFRKLILRP